MLHGGAFRFHGAGKLAIDGRPGGAGIAANQNGGLLTALATRELSGTNTWRIIWKETLVGSLNGTAFALIAGIITALWFGNTMLGLVIAVAMIINLLVAGLFGASIPILLTRLGSDPAVSSTVLLTTVTDVVGFFVFLGLAALLMF